MLREALDFSEIWWLYYFATGSFIEVQSVASDGLGDGLSEASKPPSEQSDTIPIRSKDEEAACGAESLPQGDSESEDLEPRDAGDSPNEWQDIDLVMIHVGF